jgi:hypothetical protein
LTWLRSSGKMRAMSVKARLLLGCTTIGAFEHVSEHRFKANVRVGQ